MKASNLLPLAMTVATVGCVGIDTRDVMSGALCQETSSAITSVDEVTPLGFRARDIIEFGARDFTSSLLWGSSELVAFGPESGRQSLTMQISTQGGTIMFVRSRPTEGSGTCVDHVDIPVVVHIRSDGGALDETFSAHLSASTKFYGTLTHTFDLGKLNGTFTASPTDQSKGQASRIALNVVVSPLGMTGTIRGDLETVSSSARGVTDVGYASWPASNACGTPQAGVLGLPISLDTNVGPFVGQDGLSLLEAASSALSVVWEDRTISRVSLTALSTGEGCIRFDEVLAPHYMAKFPMRFLVSTDDGRVNGDYTADLALVATSDSSLKAADGRVDLQVPVAQAASTGFVDTGDLSRYDSLTLALLVHAEAGQQSGQISLNGSKAAPCTMQPQMADLDGGTSGCQGTERAVIQRGVLIPSPSP